jgi:hypothetical protein
VIQKVHATSIYYWILSQNASAVFSQFALRSLWLQNQIEPTVEGVIYCYIPSRLDTGFPCSHICPYQCFWKYISSFTGSFRFAQLCFRAGEQADFKIWEMDRSKGLERFDMQSPYIFLYFFTLRICFLLRL